MADTFFDIENGTQKVIDNDSNHERSLKLEHSIQNEITVYKQLYQNKVSQS